MLAQRLQKKNMTAYRCSKLSGVPYTTLSELLRGKTKIKNCTAETVFKLAKVLDVPMEELLSDSIEYRSAFETFKSNVCHLVKDKGDIDFIVDTLKSDDIRRYFDKKWYPEAFYLLAMVDYLSRINDIPLCNNYNDIRGCTLKQTLYPRDIEFAARLSDELDLREASKRDAIPEFLRHNIIESDIRNVC
ncbi:MAG: helix-turn-helix transcriptional regulator [Clostridiales bacterium]|nr:helix-turn-helix transcriptional regulator [Clostridiales bacterium]